MARVVIFRRVVEEINQLNNSINEKELCGEDTDIDKKKKDALLSVLRYAVHEKWKWTGSKSKKKILTFITTGCDYNETANHFNAKSTNSIEVTISNLGKRFERIIGVHTVDFILEGRVEEAMVTARTGVGDIDLDSYFMEGFSKLLPEPTQEKIIFNIEDCQKELKLLSFFTECNLKKYVGGFSPQKLSYLLYIITSTDKLVSTERQVLNQLFSGAFNEYDISNQVKKSLEEIENRDISRNL